MASNEEEVATDLSPILRTYKDDTIDRLLVSPFAPPSLEDPTTGVSSKDITISPHVSALLYLPKLKDLNYDSKKHPILVYFHGGGFCVESAFNSLFHNYIISIVSQAKSLAVSVEYRLAPEHPLPKAYEDCWVALNWVASHSIEGSSNKEQWLVDHGDFDRVYVGGDSAGGNIAHNIAMRAGVEKLSGDVRILGGFLSHPHFWGLKPIGSEPSENREESFLSRIWKFVYPSAPGGDDNPMVNPWAEKDVKRERGVGYCEAVRENGWKGEVELVEVKGEDHCFQLFNPDTDNAKKLIKRLASFIV